MRDLVVAGIVWVFSRQRQVERVQRPAEIRQGHRAAKRRPKIQRHIPLFPAAFSILNANVIIFTTKCIIINTK